MVRRDATEDLVSEEAKESLGAWRSRSHLRHMLAGPVVDADFDGTDDLMDACRQPPARFARRIASRALTR